jgi:16S rRNA (cytosine967-C5)-methyltransferase
VAAAELWTLLTGDRSRPPESTVRAFFRQRSAMGRRDRAAIGELALQGLRHAELVAWLQEPPRGVPLALALAALDLTLGELPAEARLGRRPDLIPAVEAARQLLVDHRTLPRPHLPADVARRHGLPAWWVEAWAPLLDTDEWEAAAAALQQRAGLTLRVRLDRADAMTRVREALDRAGVRWAPGSFHPAALRVLDPWKTEGCPLFAAGWYEVQDEGSQLLAALCPTEPGARVVDVCAGAGGKTLALAAQTEGLTLVALDLEPGRLAPLEARAARAGIRGLRTAALAEGDALARDADGMLVDAPCSGSGTLRRLPDPSRIREGEVAGWVARQREALAWAADRVRPGGWVVYATCSLTPAENDGVLDAFLAARPGWRVDVTGVPGFVPLTADAAGRPVLRLWPHRHGTDGFYGVVLRRPPGG